MIQLVGAESPARAAVIANNAEDAGATTISIVRESTMIWHVFLRIPDDRDTIAAVQAALSNTPRR